MKFKSLKGIALTAATVALGIAGVVGAPDASAQPAEQFFPLLSYRTGPYAPNGTPWANGKQDYIKLVNARDGGINGVKITFEECETGYATDKGVECYERLKGKNGGATLIDPQSTGITFALTDKAPHDKIPLITLGYGLSASQGCSFPIFLALALKYLRNIGKESFMASSMASSVLRSRRAASMAEWSASLRPRRLFKTITSPLTPLRQAASVSFTPSQA